MVDLASSYCAVAGTLTEWTYVFIQYRRLDGSLAPPWTIRYGRLWFESAAIGGHAWLCACCDAFDFFGLWLGEIVFGVSTLGLTTAVHDCVPRWLDWFRVWCQDACASLGLLGGGGCLGAGVRLSQTYAFLDFTCDEVFDFLHDLFSVTSFAQ